MGFYCIADLVNYLNNQFTRAVSLREELQRLQMHLPQNEMLQAKKSHFNILEDDQQDYTI